MAIITETLGTITDLDTGEVTELVAHAPETVEDLAELFDMTMEDLADLQERAESEGWD